MPLPTAASHTLAAHPELPLADIKKQFGPAQWEKLSGLEYEAFVMMDASVRTDESLRLGKTLQRDGDRSWDELARGYAESATLHVASVGSHLDPAAEVLVVFFKRVEDGKLALVFARQKNEPEPGMYQHAVFLQTRRYD